MNLNQITKPARNLTHSATFYKKLGLRLIVDSIPRYPRFEYPEGASTFSLHQASEFNADSRIWIYFEIEELDAVVRQLIDDGFDCQEMPNDKEWGWREARLKDPDEHQLISYYGGSYRKNPPWKVKE